MTNAPAATVLHRRTLTGWDDASVLLSLLSSWREQEGLEAAAVFGAGSGADAMAGQRPRLALVGPAAALDGSTRVERELPGGYRLVYVPGGATGSAEFPEDRGLCFSLAARVAELGSKLKRRSFQESYQAVTLEAVYDVGLAIAAMLDLEQLSEEILQRAVSLLDARRGALYRLAGDSYLLEKTIGGSAADQLSDVVADALMRDKKVVEPVLEGTEHLLAVAISVDGAARGMLVVGDKESRSGVGPFATGDGRALALFANQAAIALENARLHRQALENQRLEREMELAAEIQRGLLPITNPCLVGYEIAGWNRPTRHVGGDYYGFLELGPGRLGALVADVTGKGMPAALLVSTLQSALRLLADRGLGTAELMAALNQHIAESSATNKFITLLLLELDWVNHELHFVNAGHNPGFLIRQAGDIELLMPSGMPLGMLPGTKYRRDTVVLEPGDLVCLYSDGITECESPQGEEFGQDRFAQFVAERRDASLQDLLAAIDREVTVFAGGRTQGDDQTLLLVRARDDRGESPSAANE